MATLRLRNVHRKVESPSRSKKRCLSETFIETLHTRNGFSFPEEHAASPKRFCVIQRNAQLPTASTFSNRPYIPKTLSPSRKKHYVSQALPTFHASLGAKTKSSRLMTSNKTRQKTGNGARSYNDPIKSPKCILTSICIYT